MQLLSVILAFLLAGPFGNTAREVNATQKVENISGNTIRLTFELSISRGWHVYSVNLPSGGPTSAEITFDSIRGVKPIGSLKSEGNEIEKEDPVFGMTVRYFENKVTFWQDLQILDTDWSAEGALTYGACNDESCLPPQKVEFNHRGLVLSHPESDASNDTDLSRIEGFNADTWAPVQIESEGSTGNRGLWGLFRRGLPGERLP